MTSNCCQTCACRNRGGRGCDHWSHGAHSVCNGAQHQGCSACSGNNGAGGAAGPPGPPGTQGPPGPPGSNGQPGDGNGSFFTVPVEAYQRCYQGDPVNWPDVPDVSGTWGLSKISAGEGSDVSEVCIVWRILDERETYVIPKTNFIPIGLAGSYDFRGSIENEQEYILNVQQLNNLCTTPDSVDSRFATGALIQGDIENTACTVTDKLTLRVWSIESTTGTGNSGANALSPSQLVAYSLAIQTGNPASGGGKSFVPVFSCLSPYIIGGFVEVYMAYDPSTSVEYWFANFQEVSICAAR